jgi:hypothetical protein
VRRLTQPISIEDEPRYRPEHCLPLVHTFLPIPPAGSEGRLVLPQRGRRSWENQDFRPLAFTAKLCYERDEWGKGRSLLNDRTLPDSLALVSWPLTGVRLLSNVVVLVCFSPLTKRTDLESLVGFSGRLHHSLVSDPGAQTRV